METFQKLGAGVGLDVYNGCTVAVLLPGQWVGNVGEW